MWIETRKQDLIPKWRRITQDNKFTEKYVTDFDKFFTRYNFRDMQSDIQIFFQFREMDLKKIWYISFGIMESLILNILMPWSKI